MSASKVPELAVIGASPVVEARQVEGLTCSVCCDDIGLDNYVAYRLSGGDPWCLAKAICCECLDCYIDSQNNKVKQFAEELTCLQQCSRLLKALLRGEYGIPVRLHDPVVFPGLTEEAVPNPTDPQFGRKSEVWQLSVGQQCEPRDPKLPDAPATREAIRALLRTVVQRVSDKLRDYEGGVPDSGEGEDGEVAQIVEIRTNLNRLSEMLIGAC